MYSGSVLSLVWELTPKNHHWFTTPSLALERATASHFRCSSNSTYTPSDYLSARMDTIGRGSSIGLQFMAKILGLDDHFLEGPDWGQWFTRLVLGTERIFGQKRCPYDRIKKWTEEKGRTYLVTEILCVKSGVRNSTCVNGRLTIFIEFSR